MKWLLVILILLTGCSTNSAGEGNNSSVDKYRLFTEEEMFTESELVVVVEINHKIEAFNFSTGKKASFLMPFTTYFYDTNADVVEVIKGDTDLEEVNLLFSVEDSDEFPHPEVGERYLMFLYKYDHEDYVDNNYYLVTDMNGGQIKLDGDQLVLSEYQKEKFESLGNDATLEAMMALNP